MPSLAMAVMGYHPGIEDDAVYLTAIKADLNPALYPHDRNFFQVQLQATVFDKCVAGLIRLTHLPLSATVFSLQFLSIALILFACRRIAQALFTEETAQWSGVALTAAMLTLPVAGTALYLVDQHLHPRTIATALVLLAIACILSRRRLQAILFLAFACAMHPIMAAFGISFCCFLTLSMMERSHPWARSFGGFLSASVPLGWIFEPPTPIWRQALQTRAYYFLDKWTWYEWLGALGPILLFGLLWRLSLKRDQSALARFAFAVFAYAAFQFAVAGVILESPSLVRLTPLQPMRFLHLVYFFLVLVGGCLLGKYILKSSIWRWALFLVVANTAMYLAQCAQFPGSPHLELPGVSSTNPWLQSFAWIRANTPTDAWFAMDPWYLAAPGEDYHSFRALAERSQLADMVKDPAVVTQVPELGPAWERQTRATASFQHFTLADFERLKVELGVGWVIVPFPAREGLACKYHNGSLSVCEIP